ncbi:TonB-dependent receptor [Elongatibacter sediminis]|uniref:TonB-dependent receptor n=1 Tax=Elongatibacter sediminis TaxID=3119006 RepID=A0AAW9RKU7_9GAMM
MIEMKSPFLRRQWHWSLLLMSSLFLNPTFAQVSQLEEIIVTAQKREQSIQDVPVAITAFGSDFIEDHGVLDVQDLYLYTPGYTAPPNYDFIGLSSIRGIRSNDFGYGGDPAFGIFVDGVYQGRTGASMSSIFDVQRVEVIKGPQATLFGRSATSGAISITNNRPVEGFDASLELGLGERDRQRVLATLNGELSPEFFIRGSFLSHEIDGYLNNEAGGEDLKFRDIEAFRLAARYAGEQLDATLTYNHEERRGSGNDRHQGATARFESDLMGDESFIENEHDTVVLDVTFSPTEILEFQSITAYRDSTWDYAEDFDALAIALTASPFLQGQTSELFSQEFRISGQRESLRWFVGASWFSDDVTGYIDEQVDQGFAFTGVREGFSGQPFYELGLYDGTSEGWSVYGEVSFDVTSKLELILGGRYSYDEKELEIFLQNPATDPRNTTASFPCACYLWGLYTSVPVVSQGDWDDFSLRASASYRFNDDVLGFFTYSQGFKPGGIDSFGFDTDDPSFRRFFGFDGVPAGARPKVYDPEDIDNFEVGIKSMWFDNRLRLNLSAYLFYYDGLQVAVNTSGAAFGIENVGKVRGDGLEIDLTYLLGEHWEFAAAGGVSNTEVTKLRADVTRIAEGDRLVYNPKLNGVISSTYRQALSFGGQGSVRLEYVYQDDMMGTNSLELDDYGVFNLRAGYVSRSGKWGLSAYLKNVTDEVYFTNGTGARPFTAVVDLVSGLGEPRTFGIDFTWRL